MGKTNIASKQHVKKLLQPMHSSHKGQNGILLIIAGSKQYHGAAVLAGLAATKIVDLVYFCTSRQNIPIIKKSSPLFIVSEINEYKKWIQKADALLIGPGMENNKKNKKTIALILSKNKTKKTILDATSLKMLSPKKLHSRCVVTPHKKEFEVLFKKKLAEKNIMAVSKKRPCIIVLKGETDIIAQEGKLYHNFTGNAGMTKGGTGDVLAGLIAGFACKNPLLLSCLAACYLNGRAGDELKKQKSTMYNALDLLEQIPQTYKKIVSTK